MFTDTVLLEPFGLGHPPWDHDPSDCLKSRVFSPDLDAHSALCSSSSPPSLRSVGLPFRLYNGEQLVPGHYRMPFAFPCLVTETGSLSIPICHRGYLDFMLQTSQGLKVSLYPPHSLSYFQTMNSSMLKINVYLWRYFSFS